MRLLDTESITDTYADLDRMRPYLAGFSMCGCDVQALTLARMLQDAEDWIGEAPDILNAFEQKTRRKTLFSYVFF